MKNSTLVESLNDPAFSITFKFFLIVFIPGEPLLSPPKLDSHRFLFSFLSFYSPLLPPLLLGCNVNSSNFML
jgi:hypothetical protein